MTTLPEILSAVRATLEDDHADRTYALEQIEEDLSALVGDTAPIVAQFLAPIGGAHVSVVAASDPSENYVVCEACGPLFVHPTKVKQYAMETAEKHSLKCRRLPPRSWISVSAVTR